MSWLVECKEVEMFWVNIMEKGLPFLLIRFCWLFVLGLFPGFIAKTKGRNFFLWWIYGSFLFPVALVHAILLKERY